MPNQNGEPITITQLIEHIKRDNLEQAAAFQLAGAGYLQIKTRDTEEFQTVLKDDGESPLIFTGKKAAISYLDQLVKDTHAEFGRPQKSAPAQRFELAIPQAPDTQLLELLTICKELGKFCNADGHLQQQAFTALAAFAVEFQAEMDICDLTLREVIDVIREVKTDSQLSTETGDN